MAQISYFEEIVAKFNFAYENFRTAALEALNRVFCPQVKMISWTRRTVLGFLNIVKDYTPETLSLASLKAAISRSALEYRPHHLAYVFLLLVKDEYCADDAEEFREVLVVLETRKLPYKIVFRMDVNSFRDLAFLVFNKKYYFYVIKTKSLSLKLLFRRVLINSVWKYNYYFNQSCLDKFLDYLDEAAGHALADPSEITVSLFFDVMDLINRKAEEGLISKDWRRCAVFGLFYLYRFCIRHEGFILPEQPLMDLDVIFKNKTVYFFNESYVCRENIVDVYLRKRKSALLQNIEISNPVVRSVYVVFLQSGRIDENEFYIGNRIFVSSLGKHLDTIGVTENWNGSILLEQIRYCLDLYKSNTNAKKRVTAFVKKFYLFLDEQSGGEFFRNTPYLSYNLFVSPQFVSLIEQGFEFKVWSPYDTVDGGKKIVFIVKDFHKKSRRICKDDYISVDLSMIRNSFYRSMAWKFIMSEPKRLIDASCRVILKCFLMELYEIKRQKGWITADLYLFSIYDALAIQTYLKKKYKNELSYQNSVSIVRVFLRWADGTDEMIVNDYVFNILKDKYVNPGPTNTRIVKDEEFTAIYSWLLEKAKDDTRYAQAFILMNLCVLTPIRISHACSLHQEELIFDDKLNSYVVHSNSKGTRGNISDIVLGEKANLFIKKAIAICGQVGSGCNQDVLRGQVFLHCRNGRYTVWSPRMFYCILGQACDACSIPRITAKNLRATYMTRAYLEACDSGELNEQILKIFSYHRRSGTTIENYVNHDEALAALTDSLNRGGDWQKANYQDDRRALEVTIADYQTLLGRTDDPEERMIITRDMMFLQQKLDSIQ